MSIKLLIGGSPCTYWSIAQTNNRETKAEGMGWELFKNYLIAKEKFKPDFFLYENNKSASQAIKDQIAKELGVGVDPTARFTYINSALVSAQNRQRFYVTNFGDIEQPEDRGILLKDILETGQPRSEKSPCIEASYYKGGSLSNLEKQSGKRLQVAEPVNTTSDGKAGTICEPVCVSQRGRYEDTGNRSTKGEGGTEQFYEARNDGKTNTLTTVQKDNAVAEPVKHGNPRYLLKNFKTNEEKSNTLTASSYKGIGADGMITVTEPIKVGSLPRPNGELSTSQAMLIYSQEGKSTTQMAGGGGLGGKKGLYAIPVEFVDDVPTKAVSCADDKTYPVYKVVDGLISIREKEYPIKLQDGYYIIRKLTVRECARLQTMPDDYCKAVSDSQAYKALGNGWTAEVIIHILNHALKDVSRDEEIVVLSMYDGIGTGRYCLEKMGFTNVTYHAYEIDKYPIQIALDNYPDIIEHGDAFAVREDDWKTPSQSGS